MLSREPKAPVQRRPPPEPEPVEPEELDPPLDSEESEDDDEPEQAVEIQPQPARAAERDQAVPRGWPPPAATSSIPMRRRPTVSAPDHGLTSAAAQHPTLPSNASEFAVIPDRFQHQQQPPQPMQLPTPIVASVRPATDRGSNNSSSSSSNGSTDFRMDLGTPTTSAAAPTLMSLGRLKDVYLEATTLDREIRLMDKRIDPKSRQELTRIISFCRERLSHLHTANRAVAGGAGDRGDDLSSFAPTRSAGQERHAGSATPSPRPSVDHLKTYPPSASAPTGKEFSASAPRPSLLRPPSVRASGDATSSRYRARN